MLCSCQGSKVNSLHPHSWCFIVCKWILFEMVIVSIWTKICSIPPVAFYWQNVCSRCAQLICLHVCTSFCSLLCLKLACLVNIVMYKLEITVCVAIFRQTKPQWHFWQKLCELVDSLCMKSNFLNIQMGHVLSKHIFLKLDIDSIWSVCKTLSQSLLCYCDDVNRSLSLVSVKRNCEVKPSNFFLLNVCT